MADFKKRSFGKRDSDRGGSDRGSSERGGPRSFGRDNRGGSSGRGSDFKTSFRVTCDKCQKDCDVPFKPTGNKPVYCSDCFRKNEKPSSSGRFEREERSFSPPAGNNDAINKRLDKIEEKLDKILESLSLD